MSPSTVTLHIPTIFLMIMVASAAMAVSLAVIGYQGHRSLWVWSLAQLTNVLAYAFFALRDQIPDVLSIVVANVSIAATVGLLAVGLFRFQQRKVPGWVVPLPVAVVGVGFLFFLDNFKARLLLGGVVFLAQLLHVLFVLFQGRHESPGKGKFIFGFPVALFAASMLSRVVGAFVGVDTPASLTDPTLVTTVTFMAVVLLSNLTAVGGLMMVQERAERALSDSESRYRKLIDGAGEGICVLEGGTLRFINPEGLRLLGRPAIDVVGTPFLNLVHPEDRALVIDNHNKRLKGEAENLRYPVRMLTKEGASRWIEIGGVALQWNGKPGTLNFLIDITERREAEDKVRISETRLRLLTENARDVVWTMAPGGAVTYISAAIEKVRGYTPQEAMQQTLEETLMPGSIPSVLEYLGKLHADIQARRPPENFRGEQEYRCKDGSTYWADVLVYPVLDADGGLIELVGVSRDLSERKRYEASLLEANNELKRHRDHLDERVQERTRELALARDLAQSADRAKTALLANVSHELRTPLNHIVGNAYMLAERLTEPEKKAQADTIVGASRQLLALVNDMIDMARLESQQIQLDEIDFSLRSILERADNRHRRAMQAKGLTLVLDVDTGLPDAWVGDPIRLGQVLHHFLDNAAKYSDHGQVTLRCHSAGDAGNALRFEVQDQGAGIAQDRCRRLFTLFEQGDGSFTRRQGGTGLGLAAAKRVVDLMGGEIGVDSVLGQGSRFWFIVTLKPARPITAAASPEQIDPEQVSRVAARMAKLLADDDASAFELWQASKPVVCALLKDRAEAFGQAVERFEFSEALAVLASARGELSAG
jgi:PAS domain S-box-containing protein